MSPLINRRVCAEIEGEFVLFLIGMRINRPWNPASWLPVVTAMPRMLAELARQPDLGLLHARTHFGFPNLMMVQYWRSHAQLQAYALARDHDHLPAWTAFNKRVGTRGAIGIWHETYVMAPGQAESIYVNMPAYGLGRAGTIHDAIGGGPPDPSGSRPAQNDAAKIAWSSFIGSEFAGGGRPLRIGASRVGPAPLARTGRRGFERRPQRFGSAWRVIATARRSQRHPATQG